MRVELERRSCSSLANLGKYEVFSWLQSSRVALFNCPASRSTSAIASPDIPDEIPGPLSDVRLGAAVLSVLLEWP
jgi:hypothetical protein